VIVFVLFFSLFDGGRQTDPHQCGGKYKKKYKFEKNVTKIASLR